MCDIKQLFITIFHPTYLMATSIGADHMMDGTCHILYVEMLWVWLSGGMDRVRVVLECCNELYPCWSVVMSYTCVGVL